MHATPLKDATIVLIDDSKSILLYLEDNLKAEGFTVHTYINGAEAIKDIADIKPEIILLDINMPLMNGYEVCKELKKRPILRDIPILFLSTLDSASDQVKAFQYGAVDYVTKPIIFEVLLMRINTHVNLYRLQKEHEERNASLEETVTEKMHELYTSQMSTILALAKLSEFRDEDTGFHLERVRNYCTVLAKELSLQENYSDIIDHSYIDDIGYASVLHDIGKVAIPDAILLKPGRLTPEEFVIMKEHSYFGSETLKAVLTKYPQNRFIQMGIEVAHYHHEKWNGSGYPEARSGEDIPLCARIMAVADVYDALRSERCYKKSFSHEKSYGIIEADSGTHFDPTIVEAFVKHETKFDEIWQQYAEESEHLPSGRHLERVSL